MIKKFPGYIEGVREFEPGFTPKVLANFSPGFALKPWDKSDVCLLRNPERVAMAGRCEPTTEPFQGFRL